MGAAISVRKASVTFGGLRALNEVTIDFPAGTITALIGPNGSGKSTLVNAVSGHIPQAQGEVLLLGKPLALARADRIVAEGLARTYQVPRMPPELTIEEIIRVPFQFVHRRGERPLNFRGPGEVAEFVGLNRSLDTVCANLSVPELRRLEIARALATGPQVLFLDEVMAGLPPSDSIEAIDVVRRIHRAGVTVVVIEHIMSIIADLCHHAVVLNQGEVIATGEPRTVLMMPHVQEAYLGKEFAL